MSVIRVQSCVSIKMLFAWVLVVGLASGGRPALAQTLEVVAFEWGPPMPLGPGETGMMLMGRGPAVELDEHLTAVEVVHVESRHVRTRVNGEVKTVERTYYFVRVRIDAEGSRKLRAFERAVQERSPEVEDRGGSLRTSVRIADSERGTRMFFDPETGLAEFRLVLGEEPLLALVAAVRQDWSDESDEGSTNNRWTDGQIDPP